MLKNTSANYLDFELGGLHYYCAPNGAVWVPENLELLAAEQGLPLRLETDEEQASRIQAIAFDPIEDRIRQASDMQLDHYVSAILKPPKTPKDKATRGV